MKQFKKIALLKWIMFAISAQIISACTSLSTQWFVGDEVKALGETTDAHVGQKRYRVSIEFHDSKSDDEMSRQQLLVIHSWSESEFSFAGISPLGLKLYSGDWGASGLHFQKNPLYKKIDFLLLSQEILNLEYQIENENNDDSNSESLEPKILPGVSDVKITNCKDEWCAEFRLDKSDARVNVISLNNTLKNN